MDSTIQRWKTFSACLILNWNEDGMVYDERKKRNLKNKLSLNRWAFTKDLSMKHGPHVPCHQKFGLSFNRFIRFFRLAFIVIFTAVDVGKILYNVRYHAWEYYPIYV